METPHSSNVLKVARLFKWIIRKEISASGNSDRQRWKPKLHIDALIHHICIYIYTLWLFNIAMENDPFIDDVPIKSY